eukprot:GSChrysophyteH1.ASY1.ANO1.2794.1 assembled CDS
MALGKVAALGVIAALYMAYLMTHDSASCSVWDSSNSGVNGYYYASGGEYIRRGRHGLSRLQPVDFFSIVSWGRYTSPSFSIRLSKQGWTIQNGNNVLYRNVIGSETHVDADRYIYAPPQVGWIYLGGGSPTGESEPDLTVLCQGGLALGVPTDAQTSPLKGNNSHPRSNIELLLARPVTTLLLMCLCMYSYHLYANAVDPGEVAFSYDKIWLNGEWMRLLTSAFAHYDLLHLGFNTMTLYQLGALEEEYGSAVYLYLSFDLVLWTGLGCLLLTWYMIRHMGRDDMVHQQAVGYSCVLFAWITVAAIRMGKFCPLIFAPTFCFSTFMIPVVNLPVNIGPFVLLLVTKVIIPRSSFIGHLSGILIGYPLAWVLFPLEVGVSGGAEQWVACGHPLWQVFAMLAAYFCAPWFHAGDSARLWVWTFPGFETRSFSVEFFTKSFRIAAQQAYQNIERYWSNNSSRQHSGNVYSNVHTEDPIVGDVSNSNITDSESELASSGRVSDRSQITNEGEDDHGVSLDYFVPAEQLHRYNRYKFMTLLIIVVSSISVPLMFLLLWDLTESHFLFSVNFIFCFIGPLLLLLVLQWSAHHAKRISFLTENSAVSKQCIHLLVVACVYSILYTLNVVLSFGAQVGSRSMIASDTSSGYSKNAGVDASNFILAFSAFMVISLVIQCVFLLCSLRSCGSVERSDVLHALNMSWFQNFLESNRLFE